jgi:hypothetical protein
MIIASAATASAETYSWEDAEGIHFTDNINSVPKKKRAKILAESTMNSPRSENSNVPGKKGHEQNRYPWKYVTDNNSSCPEGKKYSLSEYRGLKNDAEQYERKCDDIKNEINVPNWQSLPRNSNLYHKMTVIEHRYYVCVKERNRLQGIQHHYYNCARNVGGLALRD